jgi:hypothetical protein
VRDTTLFPHDATITRAIDSWQGFASVMTTEDRAYFEAMMNRCYKYARSIEVKSKPFENEALFMSMIFEQEKVIRYLLSKIEQIEKGKQ